MVRLLLYGTAAALVFPHVFFPESTPYSGVLLSFGTQFVGFAARPIGAAIFGHFGDRIGRKATLIVTLMLMGTATTLMGVLPSRAAIGVAAPVLLIVLRVLQGVGVGGEWGGSVLMSMEWGSQHRRGFMASWPQVGVPVGLLLSTGMIKLMSGFQHLYQRVYRRLLRDRVCRAAAHAAASGGQGAIDVRRGGRA